MANIVRIERSMVPPEERRRQLIEAEMKRWVQSYDEVNAAAREFNPYQFCEYPPEVVAEKTKESSWAAEEGRGL